jgi:hypothetical protein
MNLPKLGLLWFKIYSKALEFELCFVTKHQYEPLEDTDKKISKPSHPTKGTSPGDYLTDVAKVNFTSAESFNTKEEMVIIHRIMSQHYYYSTSQVNLSSARVSAPLPNKNAHTKQCTQDIWHFYNNTSKMLVTAMGVKPHNPCQLKPVRHNLI